MSKVNQVKRGFFAPQDFTRGSILKSLVFFSIPLLIGNIFQQLYSTIDALVLGRALGMEVLAAVGASSMVLFFFISLFMGVSVGAGVVISQAFGARNHERLQKAVSTTYGCTVVIGILISVAGYFLAEPILTLLRTPVEILDKAAVYLKIVFIGMIAMAAFNTLSGVLRAVGDSVTPLIFLIISTILNIVTDLLFVVVFGWGIDAVAWGTVLCQTVTAVLCAIRIRYLGSELHVTPRNLIIHKEIMPEILRIGLPAGIQQVVMSISNMIVQGLINTLGVSVVAGWVAFMRIDTFTIMPMMTVSMATSILVGQNIGARDLARVSQGIRRALLLTVAIGLVMSAATLAFALPLISAFIPGDTVAIQAAVQAGMDIAWRIVPFYFLLGIQFTMGSVLRGAGDAKWPMIISIFSLCAVRLPMSYLLYFITGAASAIFWAPPISWCVGVIINAVYYFRAKWRERAIERVDRMYAMKKTEAEPSVI